ncbi:twin-arginine translocation signal domain-containing protein [Acerihabitans sp. KWT182]|uniref:Twin-arginine translocation signal domain-containing protein n=1 Tax=Acerihabitans sp. KWT182 TaxID=3157919 RepID=A0AAU7Q9Y4_9GAMM
MKTLFNKHPVHLIVNEIEYFHFKEFQMKRRTFLKGAAALGLTAGSSAAHAVAAENAAPRERYALPDEIAEALARFRETIPVNFDRVYVENVVVPYFLSSFYQGKGRCCH